MASLLPPAGAGSAAALPLTLLFAPSQPRSHAHTHLPPPLQDCTFIRVSGAELVQKYIGEGARMVRELFVMAREAAPTIIFMDEVDSIGSTRGDGGGDSEVQRTMMELLNQLDGFEPTQVRSCAARCADRAPRAQGGASLFTLPRPFLLAPPPPLPLTHSRSHLAPCLRADHQNHHGHQPH